MKKKIKNALNKLVPARAKKGAEQNNTAPNQTGDAVPRITNDTVAEHREEVLSQARKYIYPLQHSRYRIVIISISIFIVAVLGFTVYTLLALYKFQNTSTFMYRITQIVPLPIAKTGSSFVHYENYLFELRRYMHYYTSQQGVDFASEEGQEQLADFKVRALDNVIADAQIKQLAKEHDITVSRAEVDAQMALLRSQNRLGTNEQVFEDVLKEFWGWSVSDFRRELHSELLAQKVVAQLDTEARQRAESILAELQAGGDFAALAQQHSDDTSTKGNGGEYGIAIQRNNHDIAPEVVEALFMLEPGATSGIITTATTQEIVKVIENNNGTLRAAHIVINLNPISQYTDKINEEQGAMRLISLPPRP